MPTGYAPNRPPVTGGRTGVVIAAPRTPSEQRAAFERGWWAIAAIAAVGIGPALTRPRNQPVADG